MGVIINRSRHIPLSGGSRPYCQEKEGQRGKTIKKMTCPPKTGCNSSSVCDIKIRTTTDCYVDLFRTSQGQKLFKKCNKMFYFMISPNDCFRGSSVKMNKWLCHCVSRPGLSILCFLYYFGQARV